jgi:hypothetical protein
MIPVYGLLVQETPCLRWSYCWKVLGILIGSYLFLLQVVPCLESVPNKCRSKLSSSEGCCSFLLH